MESVRARLGDESAGFRAAESGGRGRRDPRCLAMTSSVKRRGAGAVGTSASPTTVVREQLSATERLVEVAQELSMARDLGTIMASVRTAARELTGADGATLVLRDGDQCYYADENAIGPLWKGRRFSIDECISGWVIRHEKSVVIEDIYADSRVPHDAYRATFVKSLAMVPIRTHSPVGVLANYWAERRCATEGEVKLLRALADLTSLAMENVQLYGELEKRIQQAQDAVRAREEFIAIAAHELRTPLTAMLLQLQRLEDLSSRKDAASRDDTLIECASRSVASARRFAALVDGLLDASRLNHGHIELDLADFDLVDAAREVLERFGATAKRAECELRLQAPSPVPGRWDRLRIEQVLTNLLMNALKYGPGKPVEVTVEQRGTRAHFEVRDHGVGIAPEIAGKIFERFGRVGPVTHYAGLGLGLYLAHEVVEGHGGTIQFSSRPMLGSTFMVDLPLRPPAVTDTEPTADS